MPGRSPISVYLLPETIPPGALEGGLAVVVDVLRATTVMAHALAAGCEAIVPCLEVEEARRVAATLPSGTALLGGERAGLPIEGFDLGNSPGDYTSEACRGRTLVLTTTNGTRALLRCRDAARVVVAAFVNLGSTARLIEADGRPVHIVCAGTDGLVSLEDTLLAGALVAALDVDNRRDLDDAARMAARLWSFAEIRSETGDRDDSIVRALGLGRGGRRVRQIGLKADILDAARIDRFDLAIELRRDPIRLVAVPT